VGDFFIGQSPEEIGNWSQGFSPFYQGTLNMVPGREQGVIDTASLPLIGAGKLLGRGAEGIGSLARNAIEGTATDVGRREFLKKAGPAAAGTAIGAMAAPKILEHLLSEQVPAATEEAATRVVSPHDYHAMRAEAKVRAEHSAYETASNMHEGTPESWHDHWNATHDKAHAELLDDLHSRVEPHPTEEEINKKYNANIHGDEEYLADRLKQGWLPTDQSWLADQFPNVETVESRLRSGGEYVNPFTGNRAFMRNGKIKWTNGLKSDDTPRGIYSKTMFEVPYGHRGNGVFSTDAHHANARQKLGLADEYGYYNGPSKRTPFDEPEPDGEYKRGGFVERTTHDRKMI
jgi:hypothetical protein